MPSTGRGYDHLPEHRRRIYTSDRCADFDELIAEAAAHGKPVTITCWPDDSQPIASEQNAWDLINKLRNTRAGRAWTVRRNQPDGLGPQQRRDGAWTARVQILPKDVGREWVAAQAEAGNILAFNPAARKSKGKYICSRKIGGCGHRHSTASGLLCASCADTRAAAAERRERQQAERRQWGQGWDNPLNYAIDHGQAEPRTRREEADRAASARAGQNTDLEERLRRRAGLEMGWEERPPATRPPVTRRLRKAAQALADEAKAAKLDGPQGEYVRALIDDLKAGHGS